MGGWVLNILPPGSALEALIVLGGLVVEDQAEGAARDQAKGTELHPVEDPGSPSGANVEVGAELEHISGTLLATGKIPVLVELTLSVLGLDGLVLEAALLGSAAPAGQGRARGLRTLAQGVAAGAAAEHYPFSLLTQEELEKVNKFE
jgi:hypothetical protein